MIQAYKDSTLKQYTHQNSHTTTNVLGKNY